MRALDGNVWAASARPGDGGQARAADSRRARAIERLKWSEADFAEAAEGRMPMGKPMEEWSFGDLDAGFKQAALVLDETFIVPSTGHHPLETRSAMAYWQNGKLHLHCSTQSVVRTVDAVARWVGHSSPKMSSWFANTRAADSAARAAARCRWPFPRCCRRRPTRR